MPPAYYASMDNHNKVNHLRTITLLVSTADHVMSVMPPSSDARMTLPAPSPDMSIIIPLPTPPMIENDEDNDGHTVGVHLMDLT